MPNIIDTRDLNKRLEELEDELEALQEAISDAEDALSETTDEDVDAAHEAHEEALADLKDWEDENFEELEGLRSLSDEIPEWRHGEALINDGYFVEYAIDLADDLHGRQSQSWPFDCIDWDRAADALKMDYSSCEYQGETYWFRG
jgi:hypothetical protein